MQDYILLIFPIAIFTILFAGSRAAKKGEFHEDAWTVGQSKAMQVFAALMIVLHHLAQTITDCTRVGKGPITIWNSFGLLFTSIFFFFSGFGLYKSYKTKENYLDGFLRRRLLRILIPFAITNILYLVTVSYSRVTGVGDVITSLFGFTLINSNAWFLVELVFLYIAFYICFKWSRSERGAIVKLSCFTLLMVIGALLLGHDGSQVRGHWFMGEWWYNTTFIFILGIVVAKHENSVKGFLMKGYKVLLPVLIVLLVGWYLLEEFMLDQFGYYKEWEGHPGYTEKFISLPFQVILCALFVFLMLHVNLKLRYSNSVLRFLGGISFEIYLIHGMFRELLPGTPDSTMSDILYMALVYILSIIGAWLLAIVDNYLLKKVSK